MSGTRKSTRHQNLENNEHPTVSMSPKKPKLNQSDNEISCFQHDDLKEELANIESATELTTKADFDCSEIYKLRQNIKSTAMMEKAKLCREQQHNSPQISRTKSDMKTESIEKSNAKRRIGDSIYLNSTPTLRRGRSRTTAKDYVMKADEYFATQSEKSITSNNTLSKLKKEHFNSERIKNVKTSNPHLNYIQKNIQKLQNHYTEWLHIMEEGFTVLLYGLGSKRSLINNFLKQKLTNEPVLVINGFFPSLTIKEILDSIIVELLGLETVTNSNECFEIIERTMQTDPEDRIYLFIHNIDGVMLRSNKAQDVLSRLANITNIHVLASIDHINAPLIWDNVTRTRYNFYWMDATTFMPYEAETSYENSLLVQNSGTLALSSLQNVFASLTKNAKDIYILLVKYQLTNSGKDYTGMAFKDLYRASREGFLVSSDQALRSQLTEFIDHKLVKTKRNFDGVECLVIPLDNALLKQFLEQQDQAL